MHDGLTWIFFLPILVSEFDDAFTRWKAYAGCLQSCHEITAFSCESLLWLEFRSRDDFLVQAVALLWYSDACPGRRSAMALNC